MDDRRFIVFALAALLGYAVFLGLHTSPVAAGSDSAGYLLSAKLMAGGHLSTPLRTLPEFPPTDVFEYTPLGMIYSERLGALIPTYPIGLPLFYAFASFPAGWTLGPILVSVLMACGAVVFTYRLVRELGVSRDLAMLAAAGLAVCPLVFFTTFQPLSDTASACWNAAAVWCALRAHRRDREARATAAPGGPAWRWGVAAGAALAVTVLIRPANLLLLPALVVLLGRPRLVAAAALGGLPGALLLGWYHHTLYGSVLTTGYGSVWGMFGAEHVAPSLQKYLAWVPAFLPLSVLAAALLPWLPWRTQARQITAPLLWIFGYGAFYAFYPPTHEHRWYLRFILPMFPGLLALAVVGAEHVLGRLPAARRMLVRSTMVAVLAGLTLGAGWHHWTRSRLDALEQHNEIYRAIPTWADASLPPDAVIITQYPSCSFYVYTDRVILRSDVLSRARFAELASIARVGKRPVYAIVTRADDERTLPERLPGRWAEVERFDDFGVWRLQEAE